METHHNMNKKIDIPFVMSMNTLMGPVMCPSRNHCKVGIVEVKPLKFDADIHATLLNKYFIFHKRL